MRARVAVVVVCLAVAGCGGSGSKTTTITTKGPPALGRPAPKAEATQAAQDLGFPGFATKNTTRVGGADPIADAAGVALAVFPAAAKDSRPPAVSIVDESDWRSAISAAQLLATSVKAPVLFSQDDKLPAASKDALHQLKPTGASKLDHAKIIRIGEKVAAPSGMRDVVAGGTSAPTIARSIDTLAAQASGSRTRQVIVAPSGEQAYAMPAAGLSAKTGAPVLWTGKNSVPSPTLKAIRARKSPHIYVIGPSSAISSKAVKKLAAYGTVKRIDGSDPVTNAIAVARYSDGSFGWNVVDPGHGLVFANANRTGDAAAAAPLSATGSHAPLLLISSANSMPSALQSYLLDIQPGYDKDPVRGVYNHGWLMGDEDAISGPVQARIDTLLEIQPVAHGQ